MICANEYTMTIKAVKKSLPAVVGVLISKHLSQLEEELGKNFIKEISFYNYLEKGTVLE